MTPLSRARKPIVPKKDVHTLLLLAERKERDLNFIMADKHRSARATRKIMKGGK